MYPGRIHIRNVSDTDTPPPRSIRVTEYDTVGFFIHAPLNDL